MSLEVLEYSDGFCPLCSHQRGETPQRLRLPITHAFRERLLTDDMLWPQFPPHWHPPPEVMTSEGRLSKAVERLKGVRR